MEEIPASSRAIARRLREQAVGPTPGFSALQNRVLRMIREQLKEAEAQARSTEAEGSRTLRLPPKRLDVPGRARRAARRLTEQEHHLLITITHKLFCSPSSQMGVRKVAEQFRELGYPLGICTIYRYLGIPRHYLPLLPWNCDNCRGEARYADKFRRKDDSLTCNESSL